jgi:hypothetical protein
MLSSRSAKQLQEQVAVGVLLFVDRSCCCGGEGVIERVQGSQRKLARKIGRLKQASSNSCSRVPSSVLQIERVRDPSEQTSRMHVPEEYLGGHAFHTYKLLSPDGT